MRETAKRTGFGGHGCSACRNGSDGRRSGGDGSDRLSSGGGNDRGDDGDGSDRIDGRLRGVRSSSGAHNLWSLDTSEKMRKNREELPQLH